MPSIDWAGSVPHVVAGFLVGLVAFIPLVAALAPVLRGSNKASMVAGILALGASFAVLAGGVLAVRLLTPDGLAPFAVGEAASFIGALAALAAVLLVRLGEQRPGGNGC